MIDWNGDGKIDPIDIGVTMTMLDDDLRNGNAVKLFMEDVVDTHL